MTDHGLRQRTSWSEGVKLDSGDYKFAITGQWSHRHTACTLYRSTGRPMACQWCTIIRAVNLLKWGDKLDYGDYILVTGGTLEADLSPHVSIRSAGTREYRWLMLSSWLGTDRSGGKSQRRDAMADRFAPWWWWWWILATLHNRSQIRAANLSLSEGINLIIGDHIHNQCS